MCTVIYHMHITCTSHAHHMHVTCTSHAHHMYVTCTSHVQHSKSHAHHMHPIHSPKKVTKIVVGPGVPWVVQYCLPQVTFSLVSFQEGAQVVVRTGVIRSQPERMERMLRQFHYRMAQKEQSSQILRRRIVTIATTKLIHVCSHTKLLLYSAGQPLLLSLRPSESWRSCSGL